MERINKVLITGVGGQGVVYLTNLIAEAALLADIPIASSEIHGLAQRRGSIIAGITLGRNTYGYIEDAGADYLIGLEPLEAQRCFQYLKRTSRIIIDNCMILPHSVNTGKTSYPDVSRFIDYLTQNVSQVIYNTRYVEGFNPILRNIFILGRATRLDGFPIKYTYLATAVENLAKKHYKEESIAALRLGREYEETEDERIA